MSAAIIFLMIFLLFLGMPVGFALGTAGMIGLFCSGGLDAVKGILGTAPYGMAATYTLAAIPMFVLMAEFIFKCNIVEDLFSAAFKWLERFPGGMGPPERPAVSMAAAIGVPAGRRFPGILKAVVRAGRDARARTFACCR